MIERCVSRPVFVVGLLIAIVGLSIFQTTVIASIWEKRSQGGIEYTQRVPYVGKSILIDGIRGPQDLRNETIATDASKLAAPTTQAPKATTVVQESQAHGLTAGAQGQQESTSVAVGSSPISENESETAHQGVYSASADLRLYSDSMCAQTLTSIDWGAISPGATVTRIIYVKNVGTGKVTLSMLATNWSPPTASGPLRLAWNRESATLDVNSVLDATLTLSVASDITGIESFDVNIVISGTS